MKRNESINTFMRTSNIAKTLVSMVYTKIFHRCMGQYVCIHTIINVIGNEICFQTTRFANVRSQVKQI